MNGHASEADRIEINVVPGTYREQIRITVPYLTIQKAAGTEGEVLFTWYYGIGYQYYSTGSDGYYSKEAYETNKAAGTVANRGVDRWGCATQLSAPDFIAKDITFENSFNRYITEEEIADGVTPAPKGGVYSDTGDKPARTESSDVYTKAATERAAAIAIEDNTDRSAFYNCKFLSSQDTVYSGSKANRIYFKDCTIQGQTDYIFGGNTLVFDNCNFAWAGYSGEASGGHVTAVRNSSTDKGYLLYGGQVVKGDMQNASYAAGDFGRPWGGHDSPTAAIGVKIDAPFSTSGWSNWSTPAKESKYYEYGTMGADGKVISLSGRNCVVPSKWEALSFNPYTYLIKDGDNWDPMGVRAIWEPVIADIAKVVIPESEVVKPVAGTADAYEVSGDFTLPTTIAGLEGYEIHYETDSLYLSIDEESKATVVRPIEGTNEVKIKAYIRKTDNTLVGTSKDISFTITADSTVDPAPFKASMDEAKAEIAKVLGTPDADTGEYVLNRTVPVPTIAEADGVITKISYTTSGNVKANGTIERNPYASGNAVGTINYVIECIKGKTLLRDTVSYNVVIPPIGGDLLYADFEDGATAIGGKLTAEEGGNASGFGVTGAISATPKKATKDNVIYAFDVKGSAGATLKVKKGADDYLTVTVPSSALTDGWSTVEVNVTKDAATCKVNGTEVTGAVSLSGTIASTSELGAISLSDGTYDNIKVIDGVFNDGSKVYTTMWKASEADKDSPKGTMLMRGMTLMADANSCNAVNVTIDGEEFTYYVSNSGANGGWTNGTAKDGGIGLKFVAPADGAWTVYVTSLGSNKTFYIGSPDEEQKVTGAAGGNQALTINVKAGQTYYATVAGSKGRFVGAKYVPTEEGGAALDPDANRKYTTTWAFGEKIWGTKNIAAGSATENYVSTDADSLREADKTLVVDPTTGNFNNSGRGDEWCGWGNGAKLTVPVVNGSIITVKVYYPADSLTINGVAFGPFTGTDNVVSYTYIGAAGTVDVVSTKGGFISYIKAESPVKPAEFVAVESDVTYVSDPADTVDFDAGNVAKATAGDTVTFKAAAKAGNSISDVKVLDAADDTNISAAGLIDNKDGSWSFTMPEKAVKIKVTTVACATVGGTISNIDAADAELVKLYLKEGGTMTQVPVAEDGKYSVELISGKTYSIFGLIGGTHAYTLDKTEMTTANAPTLNIGATVVTAEPKAGTKTYDFTQPNTVVPGTEAKPFNMQNFVTSDGIVSFNVPKGDFRYYNTHGVNMSAATIKIAVAGDATINFSACAYAGSATITPVTAGITPNTETSMKAATDGGNVTFTYTGEAAVLEFNYTGSYLHGISVNNTSGGGSVSPAPKPTSVDYSFDFTGLNTKVGTDYGIFTAEEIAATAQKNFALDKDGKVLGIGDPNAAAKFTGFKYHTPEHGMNPGTVEVYVPGPVKITYGTCAWGGDVTVKNGSETVGTMNVNNGACYHSDKTNNVVSMYYNGEATTLTLSGGGYVPYLAVKTVDASEIPSESTITFSVGDSGAAGIVPAELKVAVGESFNIPENHSLYVAGKTLTKWTDGTNEYAIGAAVTPEGDMALTPVFTENGTVTTDAVQTVVFDLQRQNGAPTLAIQGTTGILVSQITVGGKKYDVKMDIDTTSGGKVANGNWTDWAQVNTGTKFTVSVGVNSVVTVGTIMGADGTYTIGGTSKTGSDQSETITTAGTCDIVVGNPSGSYWRTISVSYPIGYQL